MTNNPLVWLNDPLNWQGSDGVAARLLEHLQYSAIAVAIALVIAVPAGLLIGHSGRGGYLVSAANALRALPTLGLLVLFVVIIAPHIHGRGTAAYLIPSEIVLVVLAVPPILANTAAGVQAVPPESRDAASGMGMTDRQVLARVELPSALPLIFSGVRSAALQVIATATIASYVGLGGLGRFVYDGLAVQDYGQSTAGAVLVAVLAMAVDLLLAVIQHYLVPRGISGRFSRRATAAGPAEATVLATNSVHAKTVTTTGR